jgi:hypothetical protein
VSGGAAFGLPGAPGDYYGRKTRRLENGHCWIDVLAEGGPRIVGFGLSGDENVFAETPDVSWDNGYGLFELLGGHRLWFAPETSECSVPDSTGLTLAPIPDAAGPALRLVGAPEAPTGLRKAIEVRLDPESAAVSVRHELRNVGSRSFEGSPWAITGLRPGGTAVAPLPGPVDERNLQPSQLVVLWPYASWSDDRLLLAERFLAVSTHPGPRFKIGCLSASGSVGYVNDGRLFVLQFDPAFGSAHSDMGANLEIFADERTVELESLGPLVRLGPGDAVIHDERWVLRRVGGATDAAGIARLL